MPFICFMAGPFGRMGRIVVGTALLLSGPLAIRGALGFTLGAVGVVMFLAGAMNYCLLAPLFRAPFGGRAALTGHPR